MDESRISALLSAGADGDERLSLSLDRVEPSTVTARLTLPKLARMASADWASRRLDCCFTFDLSRKFEVIDYHASTRVLNSGGSFANKVVVNRGEALLTYESNNGYAFVRQTVSLHGDFQIDPELVRELVSDGLYASAEDVVRHEVGEVTSRWQLLQGRMTAKRWAGVTAGYAQAFIEGDPLIHDLVRIAVLKAMNRTVCCSCYGEIQHECVPGVDHACLEL